jgi:hypothetical protein
MSSNSGRFYSSTPGALPRYGDFERCLGDGLSTSMEVSLEIGATLRQLQWWDEAGLLKPIQRLHKRLYTREQVWEARRLISLRRAGASLQLCRRLMKLKTPWSEAVAVGRGVVVGSTLVVPGKGGQ